MALILTVSKISNYLKDLLLSDSLLQDIWVSGEVGNFVRSAAGHSYFTLRDGKTAALRCVMFRTSSRGSEHLLEGSAVIVHGRVAIYEQRGDLQLIADIAQPEGVGELQLKLEQLKLKLESEGLFEESRKRQPPVFPTKIGVVTSPSGAVWHDIQSIIGRRYPLAELKLAPTPVQGEAAVEGIVEAFDALNAMTDVDLIIVARGGGSLEDLWAFNEEAVVRAIFTSNVPVMSAVGHETDVTLADLVADIRAPTPSAAAEMAVPDRRELVSEIADRIRVISIFITRTLSEHQGNVGILEARRERAAPDLDGTRQKIDDQLRALDSQLRHAVISENMRVEALHQRLVSLSPADTLRRGYAIVETAGAGEIISDDRTLTLDDQVTVTLAKGGFDATVQKVYGYAS